MAHGRAKNTKFPIRRIDVVWKTRRDLVDIEISRLKDEEGSTKPDFELRTTASKNVIANMTREELTQLNEALADMVKNGYSEEHKRRLVI